MQYLRAKVRPMFQWEATLVVLFETWPNEMVKLWQVVGELNRRDLCRTTGKTFDKTIRNCLDKDLSPIVTNWGRNRFQLNTDEQATLMYKRIKQKYPWHFRESQQPTEPAPEPVGVASLKRHDPPNRNGQSADSQPLSNNGQAPSTTTGATYRIATPRQRSISGQASASSRKSRRKKQFDVSHLQELIIAEEVGDQYEGEKRPISVNSYERSREAREACIREHGYRCAVCRMSFEEEYGEIGEGYIHVHHVKPLKSSGGIRRKVNYKKDLIPICPNCHAMIHSRGHRDEPYDVEELRRIWKNAQRRKARRLKAKKGQMK